MATVDEIESACIGWLNKRRGKLTLQRTLYLVPGYEDEDGGCWIGGANTIGDVWGPRVFNNWHLAVLSRDGATSDKWKFATVRMIDFDETVQPNSFLDFGNVVRSTINPAYPDDGSAIGEFDLVTHSMGGLDAFTALVDDIDPANPVPADARTARAFNFVSMDTPYRGIPNVDARIKMSAPAKIPQCEAMRPGSPQLTLLDAASPRLASRVTRMTCYGVDSASQIEVTSGNLMADEQRFAHERHELDYRFFQIPGASHSGTQGITQSVITTANLFHTLSTGGRLSQ